MTVSIKEAPVPANGWHPRWMDNNHVLFRPFDKRIRHQSMSVWDVDGEKLTKQTQFDRSYPEFINAETGSYILRGSLLVNGEKSPLPAGSVINPISGRPCTINPPPWLVNGIKTSSKVPLKEEHGYIDRGTVFEDTKKNFPLLYYRTGFAKPIPLGLGSLQVYPWVIYLPFVGAYLLEGWPQFPDAYSMWLLFPNGYLKQIFDAKGKLWTMNARSWQAFTKRGVIFGFRKQTWLGDETLEPGIYLSEDERLTRVVEGIFQYPDVSPDGCRLALFNDRLESDLPVDGKYRLQVIDICEEASK